MRYVCASEKEETECILVPETSGAISLMVGGWLVALLGTDGVLCILPNIPKKNSAGLQVDEAGRILTWYLV